MRFNKLPENWRERTEHWYTEFDRVQKEPKHGKRVTSMNSENFPLKVVDLLSTTGKQVPQN